MRIKSNFTRILFLFAGLLFSKVSFSQTALIPQWVSIAADPDALGQTNQNMVIAQGHIYVITTFRGAADFAPGPGATRLVTQTQTQVDADIAIAKYDLDGNVLWVKQIGGTDEDQAYGITVDAAGNVYVTGGFRKTVDFNPGAGVFELTATGADPAKGGTPSSTDDDIFILKLTTNGDFVWAHAFGALTADLGYAIKAHGSHIYVTGEFRRTVDFDPGEDEHNLSATPGTPGALNTSAEIFVAKYDLDGKYVWAKSMGGTGNERPYALDVDASGNVYTIGSFPGTANFNPDGTFNITSLANNDAFISKLNTNGGFEWAKAIRGSSFHDIGTSIAIDNEGNVVAAGYFEGPVELYPDHEGEELLNGKGYYDVFVVKLRPDGSLIWARSMGGTGNFDEEASCVTVDNANNIYVGGRFQNNIDLDPGPGTDIFTVNGSRDIFLAKLDASGNYVWGKAIGGTGAENVESVVVHQEDVYITGFFGNTVDFNPEEGVLERTGTGLTTYLARYTQSTAPQPAECPVNVTFSSQADVSAFVATYSHCTTITGNVMVQGTVQNLNGLTFLQSIGGDLNFFNNPQLQSISGLAGLQSVGGNLYISNNFPLQDLTGLGALQTIGMDLRIGVSTSSTNPALQNLNGLGALQSTGGWLALTGLPQLQSLDGLSSLQTVGGPIFITNNPKLENLDELSDFHNPLHEVYIGYNAILPHVNGLSGLVNIPGRLVLTNNPKLSDISGVSGVQNIGNGLYIFNNPLLENLDALSGLQNIGQDFYIFDNTGLTSIEGLKNASLSTVNFFYIQGNGALSVCNLPNICAYLATEKHRSISGNLGNCATAAAVIAACVPASYTLTLGAGVNPTVCGGKDGSIGFTTSLEAGSYTLSFKRDDKDTTAAVSVNANGVFTLTGLGKGIYSSFSIAYPGGTVTATGERTLTDPASHTFAAGSLTHPTGCNSNNGSIAFTTNLSAGAYPMSFKKGSKDTTATITVSGGAFTLSGLSAAAYSAFSITNSGCSYTVGGPVTLTAATTTLTLEEKKDPTGCTLSDGSISLSVNLADGSYSLVYTKDSEAKTATVNVVNGSFTLSGLSHGQYSGIKLTGGGCDHVLAGSVTLESPQVPGGPITAEGSLELCEGEQVKLTAPQGVSYEWSTGAFTQSIWAAEGGIYKVKVTSSQGCVSESEITVIKKECNVPPMAVCKPVVVLVAKDDCYAILRVEDLDGGSYDLNDDWYNRSIDINPALRVGNYTATMTLVDIHGASTSCTSQVHVVDHSAPVVRTRSLTLELNEQGRASITVADVDAGSYDNCGPLQLSLNRTEFDCRDLGHHQVILTGIDGSGNVSTALADIHVVDNTPPVVIAQTLQIALDENGKATLKAEDLAQSIQDNCGIWSIQASKTEFDCDDLGENKVVLKVEDVQGGVTEAEVTVTVVDTTAPVLKATALTLYLDASGKATVTAEAAGAGSADNCGLESLTLSRTEFDCEDTGEHEIILTGKDKSGNESEQTVMITVADTTAPVILANDVTLELDNNGKATLTIEAVDRGSTDNCGIESRELQYTEFDCGDVGEHTVQYTVRDKAGNETTQTIKVTVRDVTAPVAQAQDLIVELDGSGRATLEASAINDGSYDNCGIVAMSISQEVFTCNDLGKRLITLTVRDAAGNESTARSEVLIRDPEGVCPCSYGVLAENKIVLRRNEINSGGIGTSGKKGMVKLRHTAVTEEGTFVRSEQTRFDNASESSVYIRGRAPQAEGFRANNRKEKKTERIKKGETRTFTAGNYGKIKGRKEAKLVFSGGDIQIRSIKLKKGTQVSFTATTVLLVRDQVRLGKETEFNRSGESVRLYSGGNVKISSGSEVKGYVHSRRNLRTTGGGEKYLEGFFAADRIRGSRNTNWSGGGLLCRENETQALLAKEKDGRKAAEKEEIAADSVAEAPGLRVRIWPNTFTTRIQVEIASESDGGEVVLVDLFGNVLRRESYQGKDKVLHLQTDKLDAGLYILRVSSGGQERTLRVIKNER